MDTLKQRGSIIIYAMLTMSAMLAMGLTLSGLFIGKLKSAAAARDSTTAIYIADSAVEKCLYEARGAHDSAGSLVFTGRADYDIVSPSRQFPPAVSVKDKCKDLGAASFQFRASGMFRGITRTLEITQ